MDQHEITLWLLRVVAEKDAIRARIEPVDIEPDPVRAEEAIYRAAAALLDYERSTRIAGVPQ